ncbi:MAG: hypothetical protein ACI4XL_12765 [Bacillus sp. (in: firmicutes)]
MKETITTKKEARNNLKKFSVKRGFIFWLKSNIFLFFISLVVLSNRKSWNYFDGRLYFETFLLFVELMIILLSFIACLRPRVYNDPELTNEEKQKVFKDYIDRDLEFLTSIEEEALIALDTVKGVNFTDNQTVLDAFTNDVLPLYGTAIDEAKRLRPEVEELNSPTKIMIDALEKKYEVMALLQSSIEQNDLSLQEQAIEIFHEALELEKEFQTRVREVGKMYNLTIDKQSLLNMMNKLKNLYPAELQNQE